MSTSKATPSASDFKPKDQSQASKKTKKEVIEEDDEFEDFPAEDWSDTETDGKSGKSKNLWEESWDDDETTDDFAAQLREELKKVSGKSESMS